MSYDETMFGTAPPFSFEETEGYEEKDLSASLTLRWSRKRRRWECDNAYFWHESQNKWCCRSEDGRYYHGFRSLRALLKSYVGGRLCESSRCDGARNVRAKYWFRQDGDLPRHHPLHRPVSGALFQRRDHSMSRKKKDKSAQSTRQLMGIDSVKDYCIATRMGDLVFFIIKPTNISVLPDSSISARIYALLNVVKGQAEIEMLALNSKESFERNKTFYQERQTCEELPAIRRLLEQDSTHLDRIQVLMASSREFYIIIRLRKEKDTDVFPYLSRIEQSINDNGFTTRRAAEQDLKRMLGVYFEQNVTTEQYEDYDGDRWVIVGE